MKKLTAILTLIAMLTMCGCARVEDEPEEEDVSGGVIQLQMRIPDTLDVLLTERESVREAMLIVYEPLFNVTENFGIENVLAESYTFSSDAMTLTVKLKSNVLWHNGEVLSAKDVVYTVEKIMANPESSYYENLKNLESVAAAGSGEVVFRLKKPYSQFLYALYFPIENDGVDASEAIVGTGAFRLEDRDDKQMILTRFDGWHGGRAVADKINIQYMRTSKMAQDAFSTGKLHAVSEKMIDSENYALKEGVVRTAYPNGVFEFLGFNTESGIFADSLIRVAAANAIDRSALRDVYGATTSSGFPVMTSSAAFSPSYDTAIYNIEYAQEIIFSAGWTDIDYDGKPEKAEDGKVKELAFTLIVSDADNGRIAAAGIVKEGLEEAGFTVSVEVLDSEEYQSRIKSGDYDAFLGAVFEGVPYDLEELIGSGGEVNYFGYSSSEMDAALDSAAAAVTQTAFTSAFTAIQSVFTADQPLAGLVFTDNALITQSTVEGEISPYPYSPYANIDKWSIKAA
ncbi:MAG: ABC transporter substrate-binding protein [Clostridia bacterium]|nr:ABC transporter substrate-binding protein [Clostridia bacterium]